MQLGEHLFLWTELSYYSEGGYPFMEKHMVTLPNGSDQSYIEISIMAENGVILGNITVFLLKFVSLPLLRNNLTRFRSKEITRSLNCITPSEK